ncbi:hypothetical protein ONZ45_g19195 [Pleurotus djamor]|nr:hypothetical protein ONZ45_g19195 [Pleurotus djamor]
MLNLPTMRTLELMKSSRNRDLFAIKHKVSFGDFIQFATSTTTTKSSTLMPEIPESTRLDTMVHQMNGMKKTVTGVTVTAVILALVIIGYITYRLHSKFFIRRPLNPRNLTVPTDEEQPATPPEPYIYNALSPGSNMREVDPPSVDTRDRDGETRPNHSAGALEFMGIDPFADDDSLRRASRTSSLPSYRS